MPKGPKGEKRPADAVGAAVMVAKLATGEMAEDVDDDGKNQAAVELGRKGGAFHVPLDYTSCTQKGRTSAAILQRCGLPAHCWALGALGAGAHMAMLPQLR